MHETSLLSSYFLLSLSSLPFPVNSTRAKSAAPTKIIPNISMYSYKLFLTKCNSTLAMIAATMITTPATITIFAPKEPGFNTAQKIPINNGTTIKPEGIDIPPIINLPIPNPEDTSTDCVSQYNPAARRATPPNKHNNGFFSFTVSSSCLPNAKPHIARPKLILQTVLFQNSFMEYFFTFADLNTILQLFLCDSGIFIHLHVIHGNTALFCQTSGFSL